jgi:Xaa-Pro aminopeptidase
VGVARGAGLRHYPSVSHDYAKRREELRRRLGPRGAAIVPGARRVRRNGGDGEHRFRQDSDLLYLCGFPEPESLAVITSAHPTHRFVLFVPPRDEKLEVWTGARAGVDGAVARYGADAAFPWGELEARLPEYLENVEELTYPLGRDAELDRRVLAAIASLGIKERQCITRPGRICDPRLTLHEMRLSKDAAEVATLRQSAAATAAGFAAAAAATRPGAFEYQLQAELERAFLRGRGVPGFPSIVAAGVHATTLHYEGNDGELRDGELVLIDAGAEVDGYTADVSRTFPVAGRFTVGQRRLYDAVLAAEAAAIAAARPGATLDSIHAAALRVLVERLVALGLLAGAPAALVAEEGYKRFYMHRTSHWLGLDTHDVGSLLEGGQARPLRPGVVLTIEPGLYVPDAADLPPEYRGCGIRIEDDALITPTGCELLTQEIPRTAEEVERMVRG